MSVIKLCWHFALTMFCFLFFSHHHYYHYGGHMARRDTVPGQGCLSSCRRHRRSSSLPQARNLNQTTPSSMWQEPLTSFVSFWNIFSAVKLPAFHTPREECVCNHHQRQRLPHLTVIFSDIGHVDFLEAVHKLAVKPYIIVGLHFDQVSLISMTLHLHDLHWC